MSSEQIPDIVLERYRFRELSDREAARVNERIAHDPHLRERLDALDRSDAEFRESELANELEAGVRQRVADRRHGRRSPRRAAYWTVPALVAATTVVIVLVPRSAARRTATEATHAPSADQDRIKGLRPALALYRRTATGSETLADDAVARPGDVLRIGYRAAGRPYGVILSVDARGSVTLHLPSSPSRAVPLLRDTTVLLDQAYELDDAPRWERFFFITGSEPFAVAPIVDAARRVATNDRDRRATGLLLPQGLEQTSFSIQKETRP